MGGSDQGTEVVALCGDFRGKLQNDVFIHEGSAISCINSAEKWDLKENLLTIAPIRRASSCNNTSVPISLFVALLLQLLIYFGTSE